MSGRKAYHGASLDTMVSRGIGVEHGAADIADVIVDGQRFGEITDAKRTADKYDIRPETKYRETHAIALVVLQLRLKNVEILMKRVDGSDRERPDGLLKFEGRSVGIEAVRVARRATRMASSSAFRPMCSPRLRPTRGSPRTEWWSRSSSKQRTRRP